MYSLPLQSKRRRPYRKPLIVVSVAAVAIGGYVFGPRAWHRVERAYLQAKQDRALAQAKDFFATNNPSAAAAALQVALSAQPSHAAAWRTAADLVEQAGAREAILLRRRVLELEPDEPANRLALAQTALRFGEFNTALETFGTLPDSAKTTPEGERLALALSLQGGVAPIADVLFETLKKQSPADRRLSFSHAVLRLRHPKPDKATEARRVVEGFRTQPGYELQALRELYLDAVARRENDRALQLAHELAAAPGAALGDKLSAANADLVLAKKPLEELQPALAAQAAGSAADAVQFAQWLLVLQRPDAAKAWIAGLPPARANSPEVNAWLAEWALRERDWQGLEKRLRAGAWGPVNATALQLAISTNLVGTNENEALRAKLWAEAVKAARGDLSTLRILHRLAAVWGWPNEALEAVAAIAEQFPSQAWAHEARANLCRRLKDTRGLATALGQWRRIDPLSERLRYNAALLDVLLTNTTLPENSAAKHELEQLRARHPDDASYVTSAAFALAKTGRTKEAVELAETLTAEAAGLAARAPYLAYIYALGQRPDRAAHYVALAKGGEFLPEEAGLLELAQLRVENPDAFAKRKTGKAKS